MNERGALPPIPQRAKLILPIGLVAISCAAILIKSCEAPPLIIAVYRLAVATLVMMVFTLPRTLRECRQTGHQEIFAPFLAGVFLSGHFAFWITSLKYTSVASSVIFVTTNPIFVALASALFFREKLSPILISSILVAVLGGLIIGWGDLDKGASSLYGDILALLGAVMATGYLLVGRRARRIMDLGPYITRVYGMAAIILIFFAFINGDSFFHYPPRTYLFFFLLALGPQLVGHTTLNWSLKFFSATFVAIFILGEPIGATLLAYFLLGEPLSQNIIWGGILVLLGIFLSAREERKMAAA